MARVENTHEFFEKYTGFLLRKHPWCVNTHEFIENAAKMTKASIWKRCAGASFENFDSADLAELENSGASSTNSVSADLAEIAYGNRMEIAYAGASFANSVSADLAKNLTKKCAKTKL